jgi:hypothetical protein
MEKIKVSGATVDFFKYIENNVTIYQFDSSECIPPEPMVNAMVGLKLLDEKSSLVMINHHSPGGLFPKIEQEFDCKESRLEDGRVKIVFKRKVNANNTTDFTQNSCTGGKCSH